MSDGKIPTKKATIVGRQVVENTSKPVGEDVLQSIVKSIIDETDKKQRVGTDPIKETTPVPKAPEPAQNFISEDTMKARISELEQQFEHRVRKLEEAFQTKIATLEKLLKTKLEEHKQIAEKPPVVNVTVENRARVTKKVLRDDRGLITEIVEETSTIS